MGGMIILLSLFLATALWARWDNQRYVITAVVATAWMGGIGFLDDYLKFIEGKPRGLVARYKLVGQVTFGLALGLYLLLYPIATNLEASATTLPFFKYVLWIMSPALYVAFVTFVMTAFSNAVNLTDGLDGLASGLTVISGAAFADEPRPPARALGVVDRDVRRLTGRGRSAQPLDRRCSGAGRHD
jgi:phospho-N-acetylmuramoyl-pentapeptide-transferase